MSPDSNSFKHFDFEIIKGLFHSINSIFIFQFYISLIIIYLFD